MLTIRTPIKGLEALIRTVLFHGELAPGVAKQIKEYRAEPISSKDQRLLAILDDLLADGLVTVIPSIEVLGEQITAVVEQQSLTNFSTLARGKNTRGRNATSTA